MKMWQDSKFKREQFRFVFYTVILSATYVNSRLLADYISYVLLGNKNHFKSLRVVTDVLSFYFLRNTLPLKGIRMWVTGKLGGKMRKSKYSFKVGKVQLQTLKNALSYNMALSFTKFGVISVKV
jgi:ribosomal protein S3